MYREITINDLWYINSIQVYKMRWLYLSLLLHVTLASLHIQFNGDVFSPMDSLEYDGVLYRQPGSMSMGIARSSQHVYVFSIDSGYAWSLINTTNSSQTLLNPTHQFSLQYKPWLVDSVEERIRVVYQNIHACCDAISSEVFHHCMISHDYLFFMPATDIFGNVTQIERDIEFFNQRLLRVKQMMETFLHELKEQIRRINPIKQFMEQAHGLVQRRHTSVFIGEDLETLMKEGQKYSYNSFLMLKPVLDEFTFVIPHIVEVQDMYMTSVQELQTTLRERVDYTVSVYANYTHQFTMLYDARQTRYNYCRNVSDTVLDKMSVWV